MNSAAAPSGVVRTTCPYCGVGCGVLVKNKSEIKGDPDHPANLGRLCSKGSALGETLSLTDRLLHPEIDGMPTDWATALTEVAKRFSATIAEHGPDSVALYVSGQLLTEDYYAANKFAKGFLGTANIDSNSRLCMASTVAGHKRAFGEDVVPGVYEDLELADLVVLVGSNTAWCHPVIYQRIVEAKAARPEMRVVVIDPRRTSTCEAADLHLPLRAGTDVALFSGLLAILGEDSAHEAVELARNQTPNLSTVAKICGLDEADVARFYSWFASTPKVVTVFSQGVNQSTAGADKVNAILNVHIITGRIGVPGAGPFSITGQPNAMGGREVGALANMLAAHLEWDRHGDAELLRNFWNTKNLAARPGYKAVDLFRAVADGRVRAIWIMATNPAVSMPEAEAVRAALAICETVVVSDCVRATDSADFAHIRLPALAWGEKNGTVTNSERMISRQRGFLSAPGEAKPDWWIIASVAQRMGFAHAFAWRVPADIFREHATLSGLENHGRRLFDISSLAALDDAGYDALKPTRWPCAAGQSSKARLFADGTDARLVKTPMRAPAQDVSPGFPLTLNTGRIRDQWHTMTRTGKAVRLHAHIPEPFLSIHPDDAEGIEDSSLVEVSSATGRSVLRAKLDPAQRRGEVFAPMHWTSQFCPSGRINGVVNAHVDPVSGQPELKHTPVRISPYGTSWHGFALTSFSLGTAIADWCAILPITDGWRHELAGQGDPKLAFEKMKLLLSDEVGAWISLQDQDRSIFRSVLMENDKLQACIFIGRNHKMPSRDWLISQFSAEISSIEERHNLVLGSASQAATVDTLICVCFTIGSNTIKSAIRGGCKSIEDIGSQTKAGTNCGSCKPEIQTLLTLTAA